MKPKSLIIKNIGRLVTMEEAKGRVGPLGVIEDAALFCEEGKISWLGKKSQLSNHIRGKKDLEELDAKGGVVTPGLIDCHTHLVHAGSRQQEFLWRSQGRAYWDIALEGGGIMSTVKATRAAKEDDLFEESKKRADEFLSRGVTTCEVKSGYGLDLPAELKMLNVIKRLNEHHPIRFLSTFLGAHVVPTGFKDRRADYINLVVEKMLPEVTKQGLADFCDVFVEERAFSSEEASTIANAAKQHGLQIRLHVDQFKDVDGAILAAEFDALSADHLDYVSEKGILALKEAQVIAVVLPGATFFVGGKHYAPARKMINSGVRVAISTDYNPGTNPCLDLLLTGSIAATQMGMTLDEVWQGVTKHAAAALGIEKECGTITEGRIADLVVFDAPDEYYPLYRYGSNFVKTVIKEGRVRLGKKI